MAQTYLETNTVNHNYQANSYENIEAELAAQEKHLQDNLSRIREEMLNAGDNAENLKAEAAGYRNILKQVYEDKALLEKYPDVFPYLYSVRERGKADDMEGKFTEVLQQEGDIITEAQDIAPQEERLELSYELDGIPFSISADPYDKPGEDERQLKGRISFSNKAIDELNESRLKAILEFCEKRGLSVYDIDIPMKDGVIDLDGKLAELTQKILEERKLQDIENPGAGPEDDNPEHYHTLETDGQGALSAVDGAMIAGTNGKPQKKAPPKPVEFGDLRQELIDMLEKDMKKTRGLSYFETTQTIKGVRLKVFSIYDKPDADNMKKDGVKDKNGIYVPTYSHRLYMGQDPKDGHFVFGYSTPNSKKMDDTMAGDFMGIVKKTGATHVRFSDLQNLDKGVWMVACAEKGLVPIGISINQAKAVMMVEAARKKLSSEDFNLFKKRLGEQLLENAAKKNGSDKKYFGLPKSEYDYIQNLKKGYEFGNFKDAYEDDGGLYTTTLHKIEEGAADSKEGAATTFGAMGTLRDVFDIYMKYQHETFGCFLEQGTSGRRQFTKEELEALKAIPANKPMMELSKADFMTIYSVLLPRRIEDAKKDIYEAYKRELKRNPKRADGVILGSDVFPRYKSEVNGINIYLTRNGIDTLTLPNEHNGLEFARPEQLQPGAQNTQQQSQNTQQGKQSGGNKAEGNNNNNSAAAVNAQAQNSANSR